MRPPEFVEQCKIVWLRLLNAFYWEGRGETSNTIADQDARRESASERRASERRASEQSEATGFSPDRTLSATHTPLTSPKGSIVVTKPVYQLGTISAHRYGQMTDKILNRVAPINFYQMVEQSKPHMHPDQSVSCF